MSRPIFVLLLLFGNELMVTLTKWILVRVGVALAMQIMDPLLNAFPVLIAAAALSHENWWRKR